MSELHPRLLGDCVPIGRFPLCRLLLMNDANYPWFILVPDRDNVTEIYQLSDADQQQLMQESSQLSRVIAAVFKADKINIAALGNLVPQLHLHHVVRYRKDAAWPAPVWGKVPVQPYSDAALARLIDSLRQALQDNFQFEA